MPQRVRKPRVSYTALTSAVRWSHGRLDCRRRTSQHDGQFFRQLSHSIEPPNPQEGRRRTPDAKRNLESFSPRRSERDAQPQTSLGDGVSECRWKYTPVVRIEPNGCGVYRPSHKWSAAPSRRGAPALRRPFMRWLLQRTPSSSRARAARAPHAALVPARAEAPSPVPLRRDGLGDSRTRPWPIAPRSTRPPTPTRVPFLLEPSTPRRVLALLAKRE